MLLVSDNGTGYADGHFHVDNGLIINNFTGRMIGRYITSREANNYRVCDKGYKRKLNIWQEIKAWFINQQMIVDHQIAEEAKGSLVETMKGLDR